LYRSTIKKNAKLAQEFNNTNNNYIQGLASLTDLLEAESELVVPKQLYHSAIRLQTSRNTSNKSKELKNINQ
jgi:hypothetical protein